MNVPLSFVLPSTATVTPTKKPTIFLFMQRVGSKPEWAKLHYPDGDCVAKNNELALEQIQRGWSRATGWPSFLKQPSVWEIHVRVDILEMMDTDVVS